MDKRPTSKRCGFTLVELLITLVIIGIALAFAVPGFANFMRSQRATTQANDLLVSFTFARSEAIKRGQPLAVCASDDGATCAGDDDWDDGWIVFLDVDGTAGEVDPDGTAPDDTVLRVHAALGGSTLTTDGGAAYVRFLGDGLAGFRDDFTLTPAGCEFDQQRSIDLTATGRAEVSRENC